MAPCFSTRARCGINGTCAAAAFVGTALLFGSIPVARASLEVRLLAPQHVLGEQVDGAAFSSVRHPWALRDRAAEVAATASSTAEVGVITRDGVEFEVEASSDALPENTQASLFVGLFSFSYTAPEAMVEKWMAETNIPSPHNPLRLTALFMSHFPNGRANPDDLGDACIGDAFRVDFCTRVWTCLNAVGAQGRGGGKWKVATAAASAANYRLEAFLGPPSSECVDPAQISDGLALQFPWWAPPIAEHAVSAASIGVRSAGFSRFRLLYIDKVSWWWAHQARVEPAVSWMDMMSAAINEGAQLGRVIGNGVGPPGLWLEFGVGSGKTTAFIAARLRMLFGDAAVLHGFDSFQGLPVSWEHTKLGTGTFTMYGKVPEHLEDMSNVKLHVGLFSDTLVDLDTHADIPVAFAHVDVDLYSSAVQVLSRIACQLVPGSIVVFDELVNYLGFELSGEYRAWEYVAAAYDIKWEYAGLIWHQAVPIVITQRGSAC